MRIVVFSSSIYSETAGAVAAALSKNSHVPVGALCLQTLNYGTLLRKIGQWGIHGVLSYARSKFIAAGKNGPPLHNPYLDPWLAHGGQRFTSLRQVAAVYGFPTATCRDQNSKKAIAQLRKWAPDVIVFAGGNILRREVLRVPQLGVINIHLGLLPEIRGMSSPEWSLLKGVPVGVTIHYMDCGIDTGQILSRDALPHVAKCNSLEDLRNRLVAFGVQRLQAVVQGLAHGSISSYTQAQGEQDSQFFVVHERLRALASRYLTEGCSARASAEVA